MCKNSGYKSPISLRFYKRNLFNILFLKFGNFEKQKGQALVTLLFFMLIGVAVTSSAIIVLLSNALGTNYSDQGTESYYVAESGIEF